MSSGSTAAVELSALITDDPVIRELSGDDADLRVAGAALAGPIVSDDPTLLIALVGPSGTGRSTVLNALAAEQLSRSGVLRPTTRRAVQWGERGVRLDETDVERVPAPPDGISILDTPPWETDAETVALLIAAADLALVTVNPLRYADEVTAQLVAFCDHVGVPSLLLANRVPPQDRDVLLADMEDKLGRRPAVALATANHSDGKVRVEDLQDLLRELAAQGPAVRAARRSGAVGHLKRAIAPLLDQIVARRERTRDQRFAIEAVRHESSETIPAEAAPLPWPEARLLLAETALDSATETRSALLRSVPSMPSVQLPELDAAPALDEWRERTTHGAVELVRFGPVRAVSASSIRRHAWRSAVTTDHRPSWLARVSVEGSWDEMAAAGRAALAALLATPSLALCDQALTETEDPDLPDGARLVVLVDSLFREYDDADDSVIGSIDVSPPVGSAAAASREER